MGNKIGEMFQIPMLLLIPQCSSSSNNSDDDEDDDYNFQTSEEFIFQVLPNGNPIQHGSVILYRKYTGGILSYYSTTAHCAAQLLLNRNT